MPLYESAAIILRSMRLGDSDKLVTFFTYKYGKMKAVAKGAVKTKSRYGGRLEPFNLVNMIAFGKEKAELLSLNTCDIQQMIPALCANLDTMARAWACAEFVDHLQRDRDENKEGFRLLVSTWRELAREKSNARQDLLLRIFQLKYLKTAGLKPELEKCSGCGQKGGGQLSGFSARRGGAVCRGCFQADPTAIRVSPGAMMFMKKGLEMPMEKVGRLAAGQSVVEEIEKAVATFIQAHVRREMRTDRFLRLSALPVGDPGK
ncbi:MAG: DNA repair protein RecO [Nitrospinota bacterium]|nr:DNA repair protein RecO [Nitrospinota bacterium]